MIIMHGQQKPNFVFVSGNLKKVEYLERFLGRKVEHHHLDLPEIQSLDPIEVVEHKTREAYRVLKRPVLVDDTELKIAALGGLPGTLVKFFLQTIGVDGICRLVNNSDDKSAQAAVTYGYYDGKQLRTFRVVIDGTIPDAARGEGGMGWDAAFIPAGQDKTFGQMGGEDMAKYSVRNKDVQKLAAFLEVKEKSDK